MSDVLKELKEYAALDRENCLLKDLQIRIVEDCLTISNPSTSTTTCQIFSPEEYYHVLTDGDAGSTLLDQLASLLARPYMTKIVALPDAHAGKQFPVGISCSFDPSHPDCKIIPEMIGFDINCGVRLWATNIKRSEFLSIREAFMTRAFECIGIKDRIIPLSKEIDTDKILQNGVPYLIELGIATEMDALCTESNGCLPVQNVKKLLDQKTRAAARKQLGTLGDGNHYIEVQVVGDVFDKEVCARLGLDLDTVCVSVHTGSRSVGSTAVTRLLNKCAEQQDVYMQTGTVEIPINDPLAEKYFETVNACSNFAFCNRVVIGKEVEDVFREIIKANQPSTDGPNTAQPTCVPGIGLPQDFTMQVISDSAHNIVRLEERNGKKVVRIRKGSTQIVPYGDKERKEMGAASGKEDASTSECAQQGSVHCPYVVSVGGSMSTGSYVLSAGEKGENVDYVTCHGSGRLVRRKDAKQAVTEESIKEELANANVSMRVRNINKIGEESSRTYKCIDKVVEYCKKTGLSNKVCRLIPLGGIKG
ncbi:tRNA-splicing ligase RtcB (3'-phosphate/5'-hydroxy nucleic acid ligase) [Nematocida ausubeli]|uniref:3'-phosphate/5'-hydroxy nucleic acid ligase n=1 Tax=Nematocida ausubeli (strain ATCC PRA-371 / ERTm2) TaxID=1913371 RepID=A0A086J057_NEMA1|nr:uncharacterized protein NESG_02302 [Nematocida ausubeli]KAI5136797.1 tRNA-splicing ligase RtcB (3'-phosphate/5'-hydroxy nucleic acid ligase) [Nematocida ausubeli]KAI5137189.1 tRNA-splicing ligase RtcB (3'-phosphate/5'-hydroxy nucleic acid ligase) [Nematocida ausubeli]KAI5137330.1 tRNA-splicing ligase RtcB (3'-phosphate/5'-hydroxy nucleic acid ligase) [Nematocida ausubeli]KAI5163642.1 tRNA-splicing ligase RtcB (3'-phosphate/5'-hydroxy nucleic acid ligase) [Nematocida ausubeli]KAI5163988.1 tR